MQRFRLPTTDLSSDTAALLFISWVAFFAKQELSFTSDPGPSINGITNVHTYTFGNIDASHFILEHDLRNDRWDLKSFHAVTKKKVTGVVHLAIEKTKARDLGETVAYQTTMNTEDVQADTSLRLHLPRMIADKRRYSGIFRLGDRILLSFTEKGSGDPGMDALFAPPVEIQVTVLVQAPTVFSALAERTASGVIETVAAICTLVLGRVVKAGWITFSSDARESDAAHRLQSSAELTELAYDGISLNIFEGPASNVTTRRLLNARGWLLSYHSALQQTNPDVATILLVSALEALIRGSSDKGSAELLKQFKFRLKQLCPEVIDEMIAHQNTDWAFSYKKNSTQNDLRDQLLDRIYELRSTPAHEGIGLAGNVFFARDELDSIRVYLLCVLARGAFLKFLRSSSTASS